MKALEEGDFEIGVKYGAEEFKKQILIGSSTHLYSPHIGKAGFLERIFNPIETLLPSEASVNAIDVNYKPLYFIIMHWLLAFLVIAIAGGLLFRKLLKVS